MKNLSSEQTSAESITSDDLDKLQEKETTESIISTPTVPKLAAPATPGQVPESKQIPQTVQVPQLPPAPTIDKATPTIVLELK